MESVDDLLARNRNWARQLHATDPTFLADLAHHQAPSCLWICCSDSRDPPDTIMQTPPGTIFVHRCIANLARTEDPSFAATLEFAVDVLKVPQIVVCGHTGCGGITAVVRGTTAGPVERWLEPVKRLFNAHAEALYTIADPIQRADQLAMLNVQKQISNIKASDCVQAAEVRGQAPAVYGVIYELRTGLLHKVAEPEASEDATSPEMNRNAAKKPADLW